MATLTVNRGDLFPAGTKVKLFRVGVPELGEELRRNQGANPEAWVPALVKVAEVTVSAEGGIPVPVGTGLGELPSGQPALAAAEVAGGWRYLHLRNPEVAREPVA